VAHTYPERIAYARPGNNAQFQLANGKIASAGHRDELAHDPWLAIAHLHAGGEGLGRIFLASPLSPKDLAPLVKQEDVITWDPEDGELRASRDLRIGSIVLQSKPLPPPDDTHRVPAISEALKREGEHLLDFNEPVNQWQNRVLSLRKWRPQEGWPDVSTPTLLMTNGEWLLPHLQAVETPEDLREIDLLLILQQQLSPEQRLRLEELAPASLALPDGSRLTLHYLSNGQPPWLEVPVQEVLTWEENPTVDGGAVGVTLHLLRPDGQPLAVAPDLKSFWREAYRALQPELKEDFPEVGWR
jgi:ATP-dependent helicase HrpB